MSATAASRYSKHRQFDDDGNHIPGDCRIGERSGLRKLMRAARRGKLPAERAVIIKFAQDAAERRAHRFLNLNSRARRAAA